MNYTVFTVCNLAYIGKALTLADSLFTATGNKLNIFIIDRKNEEVTNKKEITNICKITWIEDCAVPDFKRLSFKYDVIELTTSLKPFIAKILLNEAQKVIFFDPDVMVFNSLSGILSELDSHSVLLTPHYFVPKTDTEINDMQLMRFGFHNLGFFAVNNNEESQKFLDWWWNRCSAECFIDAQYGIFTDQKWLDVATGFFSFIHTSFNAGFNVAYWNLDQRNISKKDDTFYVNSDSPLVFFHFSSFNFQNPEEVSYRYYSLGNNSKEILGLLGKKYYDCLKQYNLMFSDVKYSFDYMSDGKTYVNPVLRRAYASIIDEFTPSANPFDMNGDVARFARKNHLFGKKNEKYKALGYRELKDSSTRRKINIVFCFLRFLLRIMGPNNFMNLSRLFVYLSSYQRVGNLWKK